MHAAAILSLLLIGICLASAQMTFSDGWGKRSVKSYQASGEDDKGADNPMLDECHQSYNQALIQLHHKIMVLYENYQQCQNRASSIFQTKQQN
ncbi:hypothetical protein M3Y94_01188500 [Aphelenchoides besseyi]|nr:hypothetical protein M3Y94_01188500 [Aphelenchoides besseyi]KAI6228317.1 hypothetical protein M3Y95_00609800 [Aphelenchoides besseyi]